jgi:hypothetical protein
MLLVERAVTGVEQGRGAIEPDDRLNGDAAWLG